MEKFNWIFKVSCYRASLHRMESSFNDLKTSRPLESLQEEDSETMLTMQPATGPATEAPDESVLDVTRAFYSCVGKPYKSVVMVNIFRHERRNPLMITKLENFGMKKRFSESEAFLPSFFYSVQKLQIFFS